MTHGSTTGRRYEGTVVPLRAVARPALHSTGATISGFFLWGPGPAMGVSPGPGSFPRPVPAGGLSQGVAGLQGWR
jgi:hypothetical protein